MGTLGFLTPFNASMVGGQPVQLGYNVLFQQRLAHVVRASVLHSAWQRPARWHERSVAYCLLPAASSCACLPPRHRLQSRTVLSRLLWPPWQGEPVFCTLRSRKQCEVHW